MPYINILIWYTCVDYSDWLSSAESQIKIRHKSPLFQHMTLYQNHGVSVFDIEQHRKCLQVNHVEQPNVFNSYNKNLGWLYIGIFTIVE